MHAVNIKPLQAALGAARSGFLMRSAVKRLLIR
jgi:hypothetical protein